MSGPVGLSFDINRGFDQVIGYIKDAWKAIMNKVETKEHLQHLFIASLAMHPCLEHMQADSSYNTDYVQAISKVSRSRLHRTIRDFPLISPTYDGVFGPTTILGDIGARYRIVVLLCWLISHPLPDNRRLMLISSAVQSGLTFLKSTAEKRDVEDVSCIQDLLSKLGRLGPQMEEMAKLFGTAIPVDYDGYTHLWGENDEKDLSEVIRNKAKPLWADELDRSRIRRLNVHISPHVILEQIHSADRQHPTILLPETKLDEVLITLCTSFFGLGHRATSEENVKPDAYWNAAGRA